VDGFEAFVKGSGRCLVRFVAPPRNVGRSLLADPEGHLLVRLDDSRGTELPVARDRVRRLKERLGLL
jgi:hypothetical protein